jgi:multisubunit Na+/H+ antiporter MnhE subunit
MKSLGLNLAIAVIWLLLSSEPSAGAFAIGFLAGFALLAAFSTVVGSEGYLRRSVAFVRFLLRFIAAFLIANAKVAWTVLFRSRAALQPDFVRYDIAELTRPEVLILSYCLSLTPGSTTVEIADDFKSLIFHALDAADPDAIRADIDRTLKQPILSFTR